MSRVSDYPLGGTPNQVEAWGAQVADSLSIGEWGRSQAATWPAVPAYASIVLGTGMASVFVKWTAYAPGAVNFRKKLSGVLHLSNSSGSSVTHVLVEDGVATLPAGSYEFLAGTLAQVLEVR